MSSKEPCKAKGECLNRLAWRHLDPRVCEAIDKVQSAWIGTRYSPSQRGIGDGASCYTLMAEILDRLYGRDTPTPMPQINTNAGVCGPQGKELVLAFRRNYPLDEVECGVQPGDLVVTRSVPGESGPEWEGHVMMVGVRKGQVIHALPPRVTWGSLLTGMGRILKVYRPRDKHLWAA